MQIKQAKDNLDYFSAAYELFCTHRKSPWQTDTFRKALLMPNSIIAVSDDSQQCSEILGYALVSQVADEVELEDICVAAHARRNGIANLLLSHILMQAKNQKAAHVLLEVSANNIAAIALYKKHKFLQIGIRKNYYKLANNEFSDAILMRSTNIHL